MASIHLRISARALSSCKSCLSSRVSIRLGSYFCRSREISNYTSSQIQRTLLTANRHLDSNRSLFTGIQSCTTNALETNKCFQVCLGGSSHARRFSSQDIDLENVDCNLDELKRLRDSDKVYIVDVRKSPELVKDGIIEGAVNVPLDQLEEALQLSKDDFQQKYAAPKPGSTGHAVVFFCLGGVRSLTALQIARNLGLTTSRHLPGGINAWQERFGK